VFRKEQKKQERELWPAGIAKKPKGPASTLCMEKGGHR
jgi:hypothetical protein